MFREHAGLGLTIFSHILPTSSMGLLRWETDIERTVLNILCILRLSLTGPFPWLNLHITFHGIKLWILKIQC